MLSSQTHFSGNLHSEHSHTNGSIINITRSNRWPDFANGLVVILDHRASIVVCDFNKSIGCQYDILAQLLAQHFKVCFGEHHDVFKFLRTCFAETLLMTIAQKILDGSRFGNAFFAVSFTRQRNWRSILNANRFHIASIDSELCNVAFAEVPDHIGSDAGVCTQQQQTPTILDRVFTNRAHAQFIQCDSNDILRHVPHTQRRVQPTAVSAFIRTIGRKMSIFKR